MKQKLLNYNRAIVVFLVLCLNGFHLNSQVPDYFSGNPEWRMQMQQGAFSPCLQTRDYVIYVHGDTIINSVSYKNLFSKAYNTFTDMSPGGCTLLPYSTNNHHSYVRQEGRKIFQLYEPNLIDTLLYDFELSIGDTLPASIINPYTDLVITGVDSIFMYNSYRRVFQFMNNPTISSIIEGVGQEPGYSGGLVEDFPPYFELGRNFFCFSYQDTIRLGENSPYCFFNVGIQDETKTVNALLFPNPAYSFVYLKTENANTITSVYATNTLGQSIGIPFSIINENMLILQTENLPNGVYILKIEAGKSRYSPLKLFKHP